MGSGIEAARAAAPEHAAAIDNMKDQLLLVLIKRLGGDVTIPVSEIDDTGGLLLSMQLEQFRQQPSFRFVLEKKQ